MDGEALGGDGHHIVGHPPEDLAEQPGGEHDGPVLRHVGGDGGDDPCLQVVAAEAQSAGPSLHQDPLQGLDGALGGHYPACGGDGGLQDGLFTGESHSCSFLAPPAGRGEDRFIVVARRGRGSCGKPGKAGGIKALRVHSGLHKICTASAACLWPGRASTDLHSTYRRIVEVRAGKNAGPKGPAQ